jgi:maltooligosyltrehalose trehalohydrolase
LIVNLGADLTRRSFAEPLLAPPPPCDWVLEWCTEDPRYGGTGIPDLRPERHWCIPADSAAVFKPAAEGRADQPGRRRRTA